MERSTSDKKYLFVILVFIVVIIWLFSAIGITTYLDDWSDRGTFGDLFGAVNALFSGLAFAALIYTIVLQRDEISQNRKEIIHNRKELAKNAKLQQKAQHILVEQVAQTHLSAKMNAMRTLVDYYNNQIANPNSPPEVITKAKMKRKLIIRQIDDLIDGITDSEVE